MEGLLSWQGQVYRRQVYGFNVLLMLIVLVVLILVSSVSSFNYRDNILSSFWFSLTCSFLLVSGLLSLLFTSQLDRPCLPLPEGQAKETHEEQLSRRGLGLRAATCLSSCLLVLLPGLLGLLVLATVQQRSPYLLLVDGDSGHTSTVSLSILSSLSIHGPPGEPTTTAGRASTNCSFSSEKGALQGVVLLVNKTRPACRARLAQGDLVSQATQVWRLFCQHSPPPSRPAVELWCC